MGGTLVFLLLLDAAWVATTVVRDLRGARAQMQAGSAELLAGEVDQAGTRFELARASAGRVRGALSHPAGKVLAALPWTSDEVKAIDSLSRATEFTAEAGASFVAAAEAGAPTGPTLPAFGDKGLSELVDGLSLATPHLESAVGLLAEARREVSGVQEQILLPPVRDAVISAQGTIAGSEELARSSVTLSRLLPHMLGTYDRRQYLVIMQTLADPRGAGGYPGTFGILRAGDGRLEMRDFSHTHDLGKVPPVRAPKEVEKRYERFGALTHFIATTYSPDFPTNARLLLKMWRENGGEKMDGVFSVDSVAMSYLLRASGPVETRAWPVPVTADNVSEIVDHDTFLTRSQSKSDNSQAQLGRALWEAILNRPLSPPIAGNALAQAARERHLQIYSKNPEEEGLLDDLGVTGGVEPPTNPVMVAWDGGVSSRAGYFAEKVVSYRAVLDEDGSADVTMDVSFTNHAPARPRSILLGNGRRLDGVPVGYFSAYVNVYLPENAQNIETQIPDPGLTLSEVEFERPVVLQYFGAEAGETASGQVSYTIDDASQMLEEGFEYQLDIQPQPSLRPDRVRIEVVAPENGKIWDTASQMQNKETVATYEGSPAEPLHLWVQVETPA